MQRFHGLLQRRQRCLLAGKVASFRGELLLDFAQRIRRRRANARQFLLQALLPRGQLLQRGSDAVAPRLRHAYVLFGQRNLVREFRENPGGVGDRLFQRGQQRLCGTFLLRGGFACGKRRLQFALGVAAVGRQRRFLPGNGAQRFRQLRDLLREPRFRFADEGELLLEPGHFRVGRVEPALLLVQRVAGRVVAGAQRLQLALGRAQFRLQRFQRHRQRGHLRRALFAHADGVLLLREPQQVLRLLQPAFEFTVFGGDTGLRLQAQQLVAEFEANVLDARQVLAGI